MILEYFLLNGYGIYVWPAFIFTYVSCFALYLKTVNDLNKQEVLYFNKFPSVVRSKVIIFKSKKNLKKTLSTNTNI